MRVSIITPTYERENHRQHLYKHGVLGQKFAGEWEWLIYDNSLYPSQFFEELDDPRVHYVYDENRCSIGKKRNFLSEKASGEVICHFDDDDYYAPTYIHTMLSKLQEADFCKVDAWFTFDAKTDQFYYMSTHNIPAMRYVLGPYSGQKTVEIDFESTNEKFSESIRKGYGFSYVYRKTVTKTCHFDDCNMYEDVQFHAAVEKKGFRMEYFPDERGIVIHMVHDTNTSTEFPQYRVPPLSSAPSLS